MIACSRRVAAHSNNNNASAVPARARTCTLPRNRYFFPARRRQRGALTAAAEQYLPHIRIIDEKT